MTRGGKKLIKNSMSEQIEDHVLERFEIMKSMGKGAYGIVWQVKDKKTQKVLALKKIYDAFYNEVDSQRTYREVMYLKELKDNTNIVKLEEVIRAYNDKDLYLVFEYMDADLHNVIKSNILSDIHKRFIIYQLFKALKYIHSAGLVHRDLKPSNLLINSDCLIKIADFGLARSLQNDKSCDPVVSEYVATRWYRAPEILLGSRSYSQSVDVWSAGCIVAELFLGKVLFPGKGSLNQMELLIQLLDKPSPDDIAALGSEHAESVIKSLSTNKSKSFTLLFSMMGKDGIDLVRRMLCFNPKKRISVDQVLNHPYIRDFSQKEGSFPTRSLIVLPINDNDKMEVSFYRDSIYHFIKSQEKAPQLQLHKSGLDVALPSSNPKSSLSKERGSTKDISEDKACNLIQSLTRGKSSIGDGSDPSDVAAYCTKSQFVATAEKKSILTKKKSADKGQTTKKDRLLKKKQSIELVMKSPNTEAKRVKTAIKENKTKHGGLGSMHNQKSSLHSSTVLLRRHSNAYVEEKAPAKKKDAQKRAHFRSISPQLFADCSKTLLNSKSSKPGELIRKRSTSPLSKEAIQNLLSLESTEIFFRQFEPLRKKASISKVTVSKTATKNKYDISSTGARKPSKTSIINTSTNKLSTKSSQLKGFLKGMF